MNPHTLLAWVAALFTAVSLFSHTVAARLFLLALGIVLAGLALARERANSIPLRPLPPLWIPFVLWAGWAALSILWSIEPERSVKEWRNEAFYTGAALWICYVGAQARPAGRIFLSVVAAAAAAACAVALYEYARGYAFYQRGWHGGPGNHSSALLVLMPCTVIAFWHAARARWPLWVSCGAAGLAALLLASAYTTLNRTVWIGFAVQAILLGALILRHDAARRSSLGARARRVLAVAALAALAGGAAMILNIHAQREAHGPIRALDQDSRLTLWPEIVERIGERPLAGYGFGRGLLRASLGDDESLGPNMWHAHNLFLEALLQTGIPGLALLLLLLAVIVREGWRLARDADERGAACGIALIAVVAGMLVRNMTDSLLVRQNALLFWAATGILLGLAARPWQASK